MNTQDISGINLEAYKHDFDRFKYAILSFYRIKDKEGTLKNFVPKIINDYFKYGGFSDEPFRRDPMSRYSNDYLSSDFFNYLYKNHFSDEDNLLNFLQTTIVELLQVHTVYSTIYQNDVINELLKNPVFKLNFYFDEKNSRITRIIDLGVEHVINENLLSLDQQNKRLYEECVLNFISFNKSVLKDNNSYYHEELDKMKELIDNVLTIKFNGCRLAEKDKIVGIIFDSNNQTFISVLNYVIKKIHHNESGVRENLNEKEYLYIWLELNKILYLLNRYSS